MDIRLRSYALTSFFYEKGQDICDSFWPFAIRVIEGRIKIEQIQKEIKCRYKINIPIHLLDTILKRARKKGFLSRDGELYFLTPNGIGEKDSLEDEVDLGREINELVSDIKKYMEDREVSVTQENIQTILLDFINKNLEPICRLINNDDEENHIVGHFEDDLEKHLIAYIEEASINKASLFSTLVKVIKGSILSITLGFAHNPAEFHELSSAKFKPTTVYLDSNFLFSVFGFHSEYENKAAKELFSLLKTQPFKLKVFDFTIDELTHVVSKYPQVMNQFPATIGVDSIYGVLKRKGWTAIDAWNFVAEIDLRLAENEIKIELTGVDIKNYKPRSEFVESILTSADIHNGPFSLNHDIAVIERIIELRKSKKHRIEDSEAIFLTSNLKLSRVNYEKMGHKDTGTVCEVLIDRLLTHIIWLKSPRLELPISSMIASYSKSLLINRSLWQEFYKVLTELKEDEEITDKQIATLFFHNYIEEVLRDAGDNNVPVTADFVIKHIEEIEREMERTVTSVNKQLQVTSDNLEEILGSREKEKRDFLEKQSEFTQYLVSKKKDLQTSNRKKAKRYTNWIRGSLTVIFIVILVFFTKNFRDNAIAAAIIYTSDIVIPFLVYIKAPFWKRICEKKFAKLCKEPNSLIHEIEEISKKFHMTSSG